MTLQVDHFLVTHIEFWLNSSQYIKKSVQINLMEPHFIAYKQASQRPEMKKKESRPIFPA